MKYLCTPALLFLFIGSAHACEFFGGAMPASCPREATKQWWEGSWATREVDKNGEKLTALTTLLPGEKYRTTLVFENGKRLEHWGHYKINVNPDLKNNFSSEDVADQTEEAKSIDVGVHVSINKGGLNFGGALPVGAPPSTPKRINCLRGEIEYFIEDSNPKLTYSSPQKYDFVTQGEGYVRVSGPGADGVLARRYKG